MKLVKQRNFILLSIARISSSLGTLMQSFVLALYVLNKTGSATKFASIIFIAYIPPIVISPLAGVFIDKADKKRVLVILDALSGVIVGIVVIIFSINGSISLGLIYVLVLCLSIISSIYTPAIFTIVPLTIEKEDLVLANSTISFLLSTCTLLAPALAGILYSLFGVAIILVANSLSFFTSAICAFCMKINKTETETQIKAKEETNFWSEFKAGFIFIKDRQIFLFLSVLMLVLNLTINSTLEVGIPFVLKHVLRVSDSAYGLFQSIAVTATLLAPILFAFLCKKKDVLKVLHLVVILMASITLTATILFSASFIGFWHNKYIPYVSTIGIAALLYLVEAIGSLCLFTIFQRETPTELMGRVSTLLNSIGTVFSPMGLLIYGLMLDHISPSLCFAITSIIGIGLMIYSRDVVSKNTPKQISC